MEGSFTISGEITKSILDSLRVDNLKMNFCISSNGFVQN
jgi:hypothetical protein